MTIGLKVLLPLWMALATAQPMGFGTRREDKAPVMKSDVKYIACQTCELLIRESNRAIRNLKKAAKPGHGVTEADVFGYLEKVCDPDTDEGEWLGTFDMVEDGQKLKLVDMETIGFCGTECRTIARACTDAIEEIEYDLAEALFKGVDQRAALMQRFCMDASDVCTKILPDLPKDREPGPPFVPMTEDDYKMAKMMQQMKEMGLGGQVFDQDSARQFIAENSEQDSDDDEEDTYDNRDARDDGLAERHSTDGHKESASTVEEDTRDRMHLGEFWQQGVDASMGYLRDTYDRLSKRWRRQETEL